MTEKKKYKKHRACEKIKRHIDRHQRGTPFVVTPSIVLKWWHTLNNAVFEGKLTPPMKIVCRNFRDDAHGWCQPYISGIDPNDRTLIEIGIRREQIDRKTFLTVLAHEMVHQWQWVHKERMGHGKSFVKWKPILKQTVDIALNSHL